jgi:uncharacterized repeat protein (TIGR01451 family)
MSVPWRQWLSGPLRGFYGDQRQTPPRRFRPQVESLECRAALSVLYNENVSGDVPGSQSAPAAFTLAAGTNSLIGTIGATDVQDWITLHVPANLKFSSLMLTSYVSGDLQGFIGVQRGTSFVGDSNVPSSYLGYAHFGTGATNGALPPTNLVGTDLLPLMGNNTVAFGSQGFTPPLPSGDYTFLIQQFGLATAYQLDFVTIASAAPPADLVIAKSHAGNLRRGDPGAVYTLNVSNAGNGPTVGAVQVTDTLPTGLAPTAADSGLINGWSVTTSGQAITATRSDILASGDSFPPLTLTVSVANNAPASLANVATVAGGGELNTSNDSASDSATIVDAADLTVSKSHTGVFKQGDSADTYTLSVSNIGLGATAGLVTVTDVLPAGLLPTAADIGTISGWALSTKDQTITATRADVLAGGGSYPPLVITVSVASNAAASLTNVASITGGELNASNNSASDSTSIIQAADLTIVKSHTGTFHAGDSADIYTLTISNDGPGPTDGSPVTVVDTLPTGLAPTAATSGTHNGWLSAVSGQQVVATRSDVLGPGSSYPPLVVTVSVATDVALLVTNTASVAGGGEINTTNDTALDPTATTPAADLIVSKSHSGNFRQGDAADNYTIMVANIGPAPSNGTVTVSDTLPAGLAPTAANQGAVNGWTISVSGQTISASRSDALGGGGTYPPLTVTVKVLNNAPPSVTNTAIVSGGGELNTTNDSAQDVTTIIQAAELTVSMTQAGNLTSATTGSYAIRVTNIGTGATSAPVTVTATLPPELAYTGSTSANGWTISVKGQIITATRSDALAAGAAYQDFVFNVTTRVLGPVAVTSTAIVSGGGELDSSNDTATALTTIVPPDSVRRRRGA